MGQQLMKMDQQAPQMQNQAAGSAQVREVVAAQDLPVLDWQLCGLSVHQGFSNKDTKPWILPWRKGHGATVATNGS